MEFANGDMKSFLLDDRCADELWQFLLSNLSFPDSMLQNMSHPKIVNASLFLYMVERCGKDLTEPVIRFDAYRQSLMLGCGMVGSYGRDLTISREKIKKGGGKRRKIRRSSPSRRVISRN